jgi:hypothetical protein
METRTKTIKREIEIENELNEFKILSFKSFTKHNENSVRGWFVDNSMIILDYSLDEIKNYLNLNDIEYQDKDEYTVEELNEIKISDSNIVTTENIDWTTVISIENYNRDSTLVITSETAEYTSYEQFEDIYNYLIVNNIKCKLLQYDMNNDIYYVVNDINEATEIKILK